jgi:hypothetical protein
MSSAPPSTNTSAPLPEGTLTSAPTDEDIEAEVRRRLSVWNREAPRMFPADEKDVQFWVNSWKARAARGETLPLSH